MRKALSGFLLAVVLAVPADVVSYSTIRLMDDSPGQQQHPLCRACK